MNPLAASFDESGCSSREIHVRRGLSCRSTYVIFAHVFFPLCLGFVIYLLWRSERLAVFDWIRFIRLSTAVSDWRLLAEPVGVYLPAWLLNSLPDGLWVYAVTAYYKLIWSDDPSWYSGLWCSSGFFLAVAAELGQYLALVPGYYCQWDLLFYSLGFGSATLFAKLRSNELPIQ